MEPNIYTVVVFEVTLQMYAWVFSVVMRASLLQPEPVSRNIIKDKMTAIAMAIVLRIT